MGRLAPSVVASRTINPYPANVENMVITNASKWQMGFSLAFKGLIEVLMVPAWMTARHGGGEIRADYYFR